VFVWQGEKVRRSFILLFIVYYRCVLELTRMNVVFVLDNHMINGTKLLNVAGMTRGRRDGILKSEKVRHVVKIGPMHLKGVWCVAVSSSPYTTNFSPTRT